MRAIFTFGLLMIAVVSGQQEVRPLEFVAQIHRYSPDKGNFMIAIGSVVITGRHILTAAAPLQNIPTAELRVYYSSENPNQSPDIRTVQEVLLNSANAHVALVVATWPDVGNLPIRPLALGSLPATGASCLLYFFPNFMNPLRTTEVTLRQTGCRDNNAWCGNLNVTNICNGYVGAPVICADDLRVSGFNFEPFVCSLPSTPMTPDANLVNVQAISTWLEEMTREQYSSSASSSVISVVALVAGVVFSKNL